MRRICSLFLFFLSNSSFIHLSSITFFFYLSLFLQRIWHPVRSIDLLQDEVEVDIREKKENEVINGMAGREVGGGEVGNEELVEGGAVGGVKGGVEGGVLEEGMAEVGAEEEEGKEIVMKANIVGKKAKTEKNEGKAKKLLKISVVEAKVKKEKKKEETKEVTKGVKKEEKNEKREVRSEKKQEEKANLDNRVARGMQFFPPIFHYLFLSLFAIIFLSC